MGVNTDLNTVSRGINPPEFTLLNDEDFEITVLSDKEFVTKVVKLVKTSREKGNYDLIDRGLSTLQQGRPFNSWDVVQALVQQVKETAPKSDLPIIYRHLLEKLRYSNDKFLFEIPGFLNYDEDFRIACAKADLAQDPEGVCKYIRKYGITNQEALVEIATMVAKLTTRPVRSSISGNEVNISKYIDKFGIQSEQARFEIAKIAAKNELDFSKNIGNYKFETEEDARIELAMIAIAYNDLSFSECIDNYSISSEGVRIDLADLLLDYYASKPTNIALQMLGAFSKHVDKYRISNQEVLISLANQLAKRDYSFLENIQNFRIENQEALVNFAKQVAIKDGASIAQIINRFNIKSQKALVEIAVLALWQSGSYVIKNLKNFNLDADSKAAMFARVHTYPGILIHIKSFFSEQPLASTKEALKLYEESLALYPELEILGVKKSHDLSAFLFALYEREGGKLPVSAIMPLHEEYQRLVKEPDSEEKTLRLQILTLRCSVLDYANSAPALLADLTSLLAKVSQKNPFVRKQQMQWLAEVMMICRAEHVPLSAFASRIKSFEAILNLKSPSLRTLITKDFIDELSHPFLDTLLQGRQVDPMSKNDQAFYFSALALSSLCPQIKPYKKTIWSTDEDAQVEQVSFVDRMQDLLSSKYFKDVEKTKSFLNNMYTVTQTRKLTEAQKAHVLRNLIFVKEEDITEKEQSQRLFRTLQSVAQVILLGKAEMLIKISNRKQLQQEIEKLYVSALHIKVDDFNGKFSETLGNPSLWRKPESLLTYAAKLQSIGDKAVRSELMSCLRIFVESILNQDFTDMRYGEGDATEHLGLIKKQNPKLLEEWQKGRRFPNDKYDVVDTDNPCDLLLCGSEVGSCQGVDYDPAYSKCLLAYILDPKIRLMAVKNKDGVIVARCIMKLLFDEQTRKIVLFKEKIYPEQCSKEYSNILDRACEDRAHQLGVALLAYTDEEAGNVTLKAFGGNVPFEYVDSLGFDPFATRKGYKIRDCHYIYKPQ